MRIPSGYLYYDTPIGILCLDTLFPKPPAQLRNPLTYDFPARERERDGGTAIAGS